MHLNHIHFMIKRILTLTTHRIHQLPVLVLMPHSRCNCRCVMCDIWKANYSKKEISETELQRHVHYFDKLGVKEIVFSGGEALMHTNLWNLCKLLKRKKVKLTLLTTGLLLEKNANEVCANMEAVVISLDGSEVVHDSIRNIPDGFKKLVNGMRALRAITPGLRITARTVLQKQNFRDFMGIVKAAKEIGIDEISFLAADITTTAFNHADNMMENRTSEIALDEHETTELEQLITQSFVDLKEEYDTRYIAESPQKMLKIVQYYKALNGMKNFPEVICNAPWVSAVIEADGNVRPCFFHKPYGNIYGSDFMKVINSHQAITFRKHLDVNADPVCKKCVCTLKLPLSKMI